MRWLKTEYVLKGVFLGLILAAALRQGEMEPHPYLDTLLPVNGCAVGGLVLALTAAGLAKLREGFRVRGRFGVFLLFLLLESPALVYAGLIGGTVLGVYLIQPDSELLLYAVAGGAVLGVAFGALRQVQKRSWRLGMVLALSAALVAGVLQWFGHFLDLGVAHELKDSRLFAVQLLLGIPLFYVLTFAGQEEESEVEIGAICSMLGVGLGTLFTHSPQYLTTTFVVPIVVYLYYTLRVLPGLRVLKHAFRGLSYARVGQYRRALLAYRRALQLDPRHTLARQGFWQVHRALDLNQLAGDPQLLALVDLDLCLDRAGELLVQGKPNPDQMDEARRLLELVLSQRPELAPPVAYWRSVADLHERKYEEAAAELTRVLDPTYFGRGNPQRDLVLLPAWQLALRLHDEMRRRVGEPQLAEPGRRMEALAAVERHLAGQREDRDAWELKRLLYHDLTEAEYVMAVEGEPLAADGSVAAKSAAELSPALSPPPRDFDHRYVQQLGLALINDDARWPRGGEYLRMAAHGLPALGPGIFVQIAKAQQRAGNEKEALHNFELAKRAGRSVGAKNLASDDRHAYFATLKYLGETALYHGDLDGALENFHLYTESERSGVETYRTLADLYERKTDALSALRATDQGLIYSPKDKDLLERKDRYYYSVTPEQLQARLESLRAGFDFAYCLNKAKSILDGPYNDLEWLDVAQHLTKLALVVEPASLTAKVLLARARLRYGERDEAITLLEGVRTPKPPKFASSEDEDSWYVSCQLLGDLYVEVGKPDLALPCFADFRKSARSGAKTLFKMGQAYEQLGDLPRAARCYKQVTAYEGNPLTPEAYSALHRLQTEAEGRAT
jgi:tetratricopeptide (TPR) repeat protein